MAKKPSKNQRDARGGPSKKHKNRHKSVEHKRKHYSVQPSETEWVSRPRKSHHHHRRHSTDSNTSRTSRSSRVSRSSYYGSNVSHLSSRSSRRNPGFDDYDYNDYADDESEDTDTDETWLSSESTSSEESEFERQGKINEVMWRKSNSKIFKKALIGCAIALMVLMIAYLITLIFLSFRWPVYIARKFEPSDLFFTLFRNNYMKIIVGHVPLWNFLLLLCPIFRFEAKMLRRYVIIALILCLPLPIIYFFFTFIYLGNISDMLLIKFLSQDVKRYAIDEDSKEDLDELQTFLECCGYKNGIDDFRPWTNGTELDQNEIPIRTGPIPKPRPISCCRSGPYYKDCIQDPYKNNTHDKICVEPTIGLLNDLGSFIVLLLSLFIIVHGLTIYFSIKAINRMRKRRELIYSSPIWKEMDQKASKITTTASGKPSMRTRETLLEVNDNIAQIEGNETDGASSRTKNKSNKNRQKV